MHYSYICATIDYAQYQAMNKYRSKIYQNLFNNTHIKTRTESYVNYRKIELHLKVGSKSPLWYREEKIFTKQYKSQNKI